MFLFYSILFYSIPDTQNGQLCLNFKLLVQVQHINRLHIKKQPITSPHGGFLKGEVMPKFSFCTLFLFIIIYGLCLITVFIHIKRPGGDAFFKREGGGGATITYKKTSLESSGNGR